MLLSSFAYELFIQAGSLVSIICENVGMIRNLNGEKCGKECCESDTLGARGVLCRYRQTSVRSTAPFFSPLCAVHLNKPNAGPCQGSVEICILQDLPIQHPTIRPLHIVEFLPHFSPRRPWCTRCNTNRSPARVCSEVHRALNEGALNEFIVHRVLQSKRSVGQPTAAPPLPFSLSLTPVFPCLLLLTILLR